MLSRTVVMNSLWSVFLASMLVLASVGFVACTPAPSKETVAEGSKEVTKDATTETTPETKPEPRSEVKPEPRPEPAPEPKPEPRPEPTPDDAGPTPEPAPEPAPEPQPEPKPDNSKKLSYASDIYPLFQQYGCTGGYCHGNSGGLSLQGTGSVKNLVNKSARTGKTLVTPGDLKNSYLYVKLQPNPPKGSRMPKGGGALKAAELKKVADWILQGANP